MPRPENLAQPDRREEFASAESFHEASAEYAATDTGDGTSAIRLQWIDSPLGGLVAAAHTEGIVLLEFAERARLRKQLATLRRHFRSEAVLQPDTRPDAMLDALRAQLAAYFDGRLREFTLPLVFPGTVFQQRVWQALLQIPYGETRSYQQLAQQLGDAAACRAVGTSNGLTRLAILVPCHRVVNKGGTLGGYAGALWRKQRLLALESSASFALNGSR
jgi:AraC family transcriptional regulator of adaptative response/methylated-DNA-[protein]-cysteine methyltransferase